MNPAQRAALSYPKQLGLAVIPHLHHQHALDGETVFRFPSRLSVWTILSQGSPILSHLFFFDHHHHPYHHAPTG